MKILTDNDLLNLIRHNRIHNLIVLGLISLTFMILRGMILIPHWVFPSYTQPYRQVYVGIVLVSLFILFVCVYGIYYMLKINPIFRSGNADVESVCRIKKLKHRFEINAICSIIGLNCLIMVIFALPFDLFYSL